MAVQGVLEKISGDLARRLHSLHKALLPCPGPRHVAPQFGGGPALLTLIAALASSEAAYVEALLEIRQLISECRRALAPDAAPNPGGERSTAPLVAEFDALGRSLASLLLLHKTLPSRWGKSLHAIAEPPEWRAARPSAEVREMRHWRHGRLTAAAMCNALLRLKPAFSSAYLSYTQSYLELADELSVHGSSAAQLPAALQQRIEMLHLPLRRTVQLYWLLGGLLHADRAEAAGGGRQGLRTSLDEVESHGTEQGLPTAVCHDARGLVETTWHAIDEKLCARETAQGIRVTSAPRARWRMMTK